MQPFNYFLRNYLAHKDDSHINFKEKNISMTQKNKKIIKINKI